MVQTAAMANGSCRMVRILVEFMSSPGRVWYLPDIDHIGPRAGEHKRHIGPRAGEHKRHILE